MAWIIVDERAWSQCSTTGIGLKELSRFDEALGSNEPSRRASRRPSQTLPR
jgi:hypothetical protein